jgi:cytochrome c oxidase subunit 3
MSSEVVNQRKKIHPHKFTLWVGIASIIMMFAGLTSAYIVKGSLPGWTPVTMPVLFNYSTLVLLLSSLTLQMAVKTFKERNKNRYRNLLAVTFVLGSLFIAMQIIGFSQLYAAGIKMEGSGAGQFLYIIFGLHGLHVLGGIIALIVMLLKALRISIKSYNPIPVEVLATYWHFIDLLWIYLFVFFLLRF